MAMVDTFLDVADAAEQRHSAKLEAALSTGMDEMISRMVRPNVSIEMSAAARGRVSRALGEMWGDVIKTSADVTEAALREVASKAESAVVARLISDYIGRFGGYRAAQILLTTEHQIRDMMLGGMARGEAQEAVFRSISERIPELAEARATLITRTEVHAANQFTSQRIAETSGLNLLKTWNTVKDDRTRRFGLLGRQDAFNHLVMDGTTVKLQDFFAVPAKTGGFESLLFPGHPGGSAGNVINCRCVQTYERDY